MKVTLVDVLMNYNSIFTLAQMETRRTALLEMNAAQLEAEAKEFCGGRPWAEWLRIQATREAFDALRTP